MSVIVYGCETWALTKREENELRGFEKKVLRKIYEPKKDEVTGEWRKQYNYKLRALYDSLDITRVMRARELG